jgi:CheY-like chemotaxis protein
MKISSTGERFKTRVGSLSGNRALTPANDKSGGNNCMIKYNSDTENSSEPSKPDGNSAESVETEFNILDKTFSRPEIKTPEYSVENKRILFMDDELLITMTAGHILSGAGYDVVLAANGEEAVDIYSKAFSLQNAFSLIILDLTVPGGMGGSETLRTILNINPSAQAIVTSGYLNDKVMSEYKEFGFIGILPKPFTGDDLLKVVADCLNVTGYEIADPMS